MANVPTFAQWLCLTDDERAQLLSSWNAYAGEGETLVRDVMDRRQAEYAQLKGVTITGPGVYHCGEWIWPVIPNVLHRSSCTQCPEPRRRAPERVTATMRRLRAFHAVRPTE